MTLSEILEALTVYTGEFPREAVEAAVERREEMVPELLRALDEALERPKGLRDGSKQLHLYALYLLTQFREPAAFPYLLRFVRLPTDLLDAALGDLVTEDLPRMLATLGRDDVAALRELIEDPEVDEYVRGSGIRALEEMVFAGDLSRDEVVAYLGELLSGRLESEPSHAWDSAVSVALDLHAIETGWLIHRAYRYGFVDPGFISLKEVEEGLAEDRELVLARSRRKVRGPIEDTVREMSWWACFQPKRPARRRSRPRELDGGLGWPVPYVREQPKIGRNDPCPCGSGKKYKKCCLRSEQGLG